MWRLLFLQAESNYVWCPVLSMNNLILDICVGEAIAIEIHWTLYLLMFVTLLVWLSISNGERGLEETLGWSLVCFGICGLQSIWSIQGEEIEAYAETLTASFKNRRTILCVMIWWHLTWYDLYILSPIQQGFYGTSSICYQYYIHKITKPLLSSLNKSVGCWE